jgi:hypothetical protein
MWRDGGRAKAGTDHMLLRGDRGRATCMDVHTSSSGHARLSGCALLPLIQLHPSAQLDPENGIQPATIPPGRRSEILAPSTQALIVQGPARRVCNR